MIRFGLSGAGKFQSGKGLLYRKPVKNQLLFLYAAAPTPTEIKHIAHDFALKESLFHEYSKEPFSRKLKSKPFQFVMRDYFEDGKKVSTTHLLFIVLEKTLILVTSRKVSYYDELCKDIFEEMEETSLNTVPQLLHSVLERDIEDNYDVLETTEEFIVALEKEASTKDQNVSVKKILTLKKDLLRMSRQFEASTKIIAMLRKGKVVNVDNETKELLAELHDTFHNQMNVATTQREMLSDIMSVYSTNVSNRLSTASNELNIVMKRLAGFALIIMVPTLITGIYGMNFRFLPLAQHQFGFWIMIILMIMSGVWLGIILGKKGWL